MGRKAFKFHEEWAQILLSLPAKERHMLTDAIIGYFLRRTIPKFDESVLAGIFQMFKTKMDEDIQREEDKSAKCSNNVQVRWAKKSTQQEAKRHEPERCVRKDTKPTKNKYAPYVMLTESEYNKLIEHYGQDGADWMITKLDNYKEARGMTYKSDYRAILNWVVKEYEKENHGKTSEVRRSDAVSSAPTARQQRDSDFAEHIARKLSSS